MTRKAFRFKHFNVEQSGSVMPVTTDACLFGASIDIENSGNVLDIGSGTGLLSLMLAQRFPDPHITAIDIDPDSVALSARNFLNSHWKDKLHAIQGDINTFQFERSFRTIVCNPPFFEDQLASPDPHRNRARHILSYRDLISAIARNSAEEVQVFLLIPSIHEKMITEHFREHNFHLNQKTEIRSFENSTPHVLILEFSKARENRTSEPIVIYTSTNMYSEKTKTLLREFYLSL